MNYSHSPVVVHANIQISCRAMLMRLFNDEEAVVDSTNKNKARSRANTNSELPDGEVLPDSEVFPNIEDVAEVDPELEAQDIEGGKPDL